MSLCPLEVYKNIQKIAKNEQSLSQNCSALDNLITNCAQKLDNLFG